MADLIGSRIERKEDRNLTVYQLDIYYTIFYGICKELFF